MFTWFMFKEIVWELFIQDMIFNGDTFDKALGIVAIGIVAIPFIIIFNLTGLFLDLLCIPLYLLIGLVYLILKLIERNEQNGKRK